MPTRERLIGYHYFLPEDTPVCENCKHFHTHYTMDGFRMPMGHCVTPRLKPRRATDTCEHFEKKEQ